MEVWATSRQGGLWSEIFEPITRGNLVQNLSDREISMYKYYRQGRGLAY